MRVQLESPISPPTADHLPWKVQAEIGSSPLWIDQSESEVLAVVLDAYSGSYVLAVDVDFLHEDEKDTTRLPADDAGHAIRFTGARAAASVMTMYAGQERDRSIREGSGPYFGKGSPLPAAEC